MKLFDRIMAKITGRSATSESGQSYQQSERSLTTLSRFEKTILSWDREQARIALAILATGHGDRGPIESIFGKRATVRNAIQRLTVGHIRVLESAMKEIFPEPFDEFASDKEEED